MSVPHLDTRVVDGEPSLLFGPYAGFSPKFLKTGSMFDLPLSIRPHNLGPMLGVASTTGPHEVPGHELLQSGAAKVRTLREFCPRRRATTGN